MKFRVWASEVGMSWKYGKSRVVARMTRFRYWNGEGIADSVLVRAPHGH